MDEMEKVEDPEQVQKMEVEKRPLVKSKLLNVNVYIHCARLHAELTWAVAMLGLSKKNYRLELQPKVLADPIHTRCKHLFRLL